MTLKAKVYDFKIKKKINIAFLKTNHTWLNIVTDNRNTETSETV